MATSYKDKLRVLGGGVAAGAVALSVFAGAAQAETNTVVGEEYTPTIWIDPDGC